MFHLHRGKATIEYVALIHVKDESGKHVFSSFDLISNGNERMSLLTDNPRAPKTPEEEAAIKEQRQGELKELGTNLVLPGVGFFAAGCVAAYMMLRIIRNRPSYVIQVRTSPSGKERLCAATMKVHAMRGKTPDAAWQFSQLSLDIQGRAKRVNLLEQERK
ncbi:hypothetical protein DYB32_007923 [Aphanomyces invadans]|uniref:Uncharacterized protein n=1 Tax=Aphanomyces invadans TaxID=157072 RepID=A0A418AMN0_9STRA|nr:hypothetical protein DYB32_007923 [Aphanomyces invadans]